jgi:hypothetical protein
MLMEYINIRGHQCAECTAPWYAYKNTKAVHVLVATGCKLSLSEGSVRNGNSFGFYEKTNNKFRCTSSPNATTNFWFGGYF